MHFPGLRIEEILKEENGFSQLEPTEGMRETVD